MCTALPSTPVVVTLPLTDLSAGTAIVPLPEAAVLTAGTSLLPLRLTLPLSAMPIVEQPDRASAAVKTQILRDQSILCTRIFISFSLQDEKQLGVAAGRNRLLDYPAQ